MVSQIYTFLSNNRSQPEISKLQGKPVIYDQNTRRFWKPEAVLFGDFSAEFGTYRLYLGEDAGEWTGLFTQLGVRNQPRPIDDYVRLLAEISQRFGSKPLDEAEAGLVYNAYNRLSAVISGLPEGGGTPDWLKPLPGLPLVLNEQRLLEPGNTLFFKDRPELLEKFPGQAVHTALYSDEKVYPLLHRLGVRALSQSVSRDLLKIDNGKLDYNSTNRLQALKSQFQRIKAHYERRKQKGWRSQDWLAAVKVFQASSIQVQYRLKYSNLVLTGVSEETTAIFDEANKTLYVSNLQQQDVTLAIARELVSLLNPGADPASLTPLLEKLLDTELSKTDLVLDRYEIDRLDGNPPPVLNKSAGPKFGVLKGPDEPLQAAIDFNEAAKPAASVPPPVRPKDTQLKFKDVKLENIAGSEPEPSTDSLSEFTAGNSALPLNCNPKYTFLKPVVDAFRGAARLSPIIFTTDKQWSRPEQVHWIDSTKFRAMAEDYMSSISPVNFRGPLRDFMAELGARPLTIQEYFNFVQANVQPGVKLEEAHPVINSREKFMAVFDYLAGQPADLRTQALSAMGGVPLCLDHAHQCLWAFKKYTLYLADSETRQLLPLGALWLVDAEWEERFKLLLKGLLPEFGAVEMVEYLGEIAPQALDRPITASHPMVNSRPKLKAVFEYLAKRNVFNHFSNLAGLPLCVAADHTIRAVGPGLYLADPETRQLLKSTGLLFVSEEIENEASYVQFLLRAGVPAITPGLLVTMLKGWCQSRQPLSAAPPLIGTVELLLGFYRFFYKRYQSGTLSTTDLAALKATPIFLTQQDQLAPISDPSHPLSLPPATNHAQLEQFSDILHLDILLSDKILDDETRLFFKNVLGVPELSALEYLGRYIAPHYERPDYGHGEKLRLLRLVLEFYPQLRGPEGFEILERLRQARLIRCQDDVYRRADELYFASEFLDEVLAGNYYFPHSSYGLTAGKQRGSDSKGPEDSEWYPLFKALYTLSEPKAADLLASVQKTVNSLPPSDAGAFQHIRRVYMYLNEQWETTYSKAVITLAPLRDLKWLPAEADSERWHRPAELYAANLRTLIESQARVIPFGQIKREYSEFIGLKFRTSIGRCGEPFIAPQPGK